MSIRDFIAGENSEHKRIAEVIEGLDISEFVKDEILHAISREV